MNRRRLSSQLSLGALIVTLPISVVMLVLAGRPELAGVDARRLLQVAAIALPLLAVALTRLFARRVAARLASLGAACDAVAAGTTDVRVTVVADDEVGQVEAAFNRAAGAVRSPVGSREGDTRMPDGLRTTVEVYGAFAQRVARGDLTARVSASVDDPALVALGGKLNHMAECLSASSDRVRAMARQMAGATNQILAVASEHTAATSQQAASVAETSVTIDEVRASAQQVAERAGELAEQATGMADISAQGSTAVDEIVSGMTVIRSRVAQIAQDITALSERTQAIESITRSVNDLADQSNMLALNATIEAARAGEQGRGFAVVAQEVRSLAEQSKAATAQVQEILGDIQRATHTAVLATEEGTRAVEIGSERALLAGGAIDRMEVNIQEAARFATTIAASVREQNLGMDQIAQAVADVSSSSAQIAIGAGDTQGAAAMLSELAEELNEITGTSRVADTDPDPDVHAAFDQRETPPLSTDAIQTAMSFDELARNAAKALAVECAVVARFTDGQVVPVGTFLPSGQSLPPFRPDGIGGFATVFRTGGAARVSDYSRLKRDRVARVAAAGSYTSSVTVPIRCDGELWGAVLAATSAEKPISLGAETLLTRVAQRAAELASNNAHTRGDELLAAAAV